MSFELFIDTTGFSQYNTIRCGFGCVFIDNAEKTIFNYMTHTSEDDKHYRPKDPLNYLGIEYKEWIVANRLLEEVVDLIAQSTRTPGIVTEDGMLEISDQSTAGRRVMRLTDHNKIGGMGEGESSLVFDSSGENGHPCNNRLEIGINTCPAATHFFNDSNFPYALTVYGHFACLRPGTLGKIVRVPQATNPPETESYFPVPEWILEQLGYPVVEGMKYLETPQIAPAEYSLVGFELNRLRRGLQGKKL